MKVLSKVYPLISNLKFDYIMSLNLHSHINIKFKILSIKLNIIKVKLYNNL